LNHGGRNAADFLWKVRNKPMKDENMTDVELSAECEAEMSDGKGVEDE
jgi:hypothetical protein